MREERGLVHVGVCERRPSLLQKLGGSGGELEGAVYEGADDEGRK